MILNIMPDHLDRHQHLRRIHVEAKARIFENQQSSDFTVLNADDPATIGLSERTLAQRFVFSRKKEIGIGAFVRRAHIYFRDGSNTPKNGVLLPSRE